MSPAPRRAPAQVVTSLMTLWANPATFYEVFRVMVWALGASSLSLAPAPTRPLAHNPNLRVLSQVCSVTQLGDADAVCPQLL